MKLTYRGPHDRVLVPVGDGREIEVSNGESADFPAGVARALEKSGDWQRVEAEKPKTKPAGNGKG
jgi:uncharacterized protein YjlB